MQTFNRICLRDQTLVDEDRTMDLKRGRDYLTSAVRGDGTVMVFSTYWARVPVEWFGGEVEFTKADAGARPI